MHTFRSWSRSAWLLHGYLIASMFLLPAAPVRADWFDSDSDAVLDTWEDTINSVSYSLADLDAMSLDIDSDGAYNSEEMAYGSDPFSLDTDDDGLTDGDEIHLANEQAGKGYSLTNWDSNGDEVSDHDDFYGFFSVTYPGGMLPAYDNASYSDYDGDGIKNPFDLYPTDPTNNDADGDGIDDSIDPDSADASNYSYINYIFWYGDALGDNDSDAIQNYWDEWPDDSSNGSNDSDGDGIDNASDPYPNDNSNYSDVNGIYWYGDVFGDADTDGTLNYEDGWPYDASNGTDPGYTNDNDGDGIENDFDPAPDDPDNYSATNNTYWYYYPLEDADDDGESNFDDPYPYDTFDNIPDYDGDGWGNEEDPFPKDNSNYSDVNQTAWGAAMFDDNDGDGLYNWQDSYPDDFYNGDPDYDADGIDNDSDPYPTDGGNYSDINQISWGPNVLGDDDMDGILNWEDASPQDPTTLDSDGDGIPDIEDPVPGDSSNYSDYNDTSWYGNALGDDDYDGTANFWDQWPNDSSNGTGTGDADADGIPDADDPAPSDPSNYSSYNATSWYSDALNDDDGDGTLNFWDEWPSDSTNGTGPYDEDGDGIMDSEDPVPWDYSNYSDYNYTYWYSEALNDDDYDGTANFWDQWPYDSSNGTGSYDSDGDGIPDNEDPAPSDYSNYSYNNGSYWYGDALGDADWDGIVNFYDYDPYGDSNADSDGDGYLDSNDPAPSDSSNYSSINGQWWYGSALNDDDADGTENFYDDTPSGDPPVDADGDGLNADDEAYYGTSDDDVDSDDDGLTDGEEVNIFGSDPANAHSISQGRGWGDLYTDWDLADLTDTDTDGIPDRIEQHYGMNPNWAGDALLDRDNDGVNNTTQYNAGIALDAHLSTYDADGDGMTDVFEDAHSQVLSKSNPADAVLDADGDGVLNYEEQILLISPQQADTLQQGGLGDLQVLMLSVRYPDGSNPSEDDVDSNGIPDWADAVKETPTAPDYYHFTRQAVDDLDGDGMLDAWEHQYGRWKFTTNGLQLRLADGEEDADGDGLPNLFEYMIGTSPLAGDSDGNSVNDEDEDFDGDGLTNGQELALGTNALSADTDGDGISDSQEVAEGTDPLDALSNTAALTGLRIFTPISSL